MSFSWKVVDGRIEFSVPNSGGTAILSGLDVSAPAGFLPLVTFHTGNEVLGEAIEVDPAEYSEEGREALRQLLRHLGYKKSEQWSWVFTPPTAPAAPAASTSKKPALVQCPKCKGKGFVQFAGWKEPGVCLCCDGSKKVTIERATKHRKFVADRTAALNAKKQPTKEDRF